VVVEASEGVKRLAGSELNNYGPDSLGIIPDGVAWAEQRNYQLNCRQEEGGSGSRTNECRGKREMVSMEVLGSGLVFSASEWTPSLPRLVGSLKLIGRQSEQESQATDEQIVAQPAESVRQLCL
jgi:hypothetical protein